MINIVGTANSISSKGETEGQREGRYHRIKRFREVKGSKLSVNGSVIVRT